MLGKGNKEVSNCYKQLIVNHANSGNWDVSCMLVKYSFIKVKCIHKVVWRLGCNSETWEVEASFGMDFYLETFSFSLMWLNDAHGKTYLLFCLLLYRVRS